jgi:predicted nuclease with TOPRIM domain
MPMNVSKQEFDARNLEVNSAIERLHADVKSSYSSMREFMVSLEAHIDEKFDALDGKFNALDGKFNTLDGKFNKLDGKVDRMDQRLTRLTDEVSHMNLNFGARFDVISGQLRLIDQGQFRTEERLSNLERRVDTLEDKAS